VWYPLNSLLNHMKDHQNLNLLTIGSVFGTVLLVNVYWWELTGLLTALFLCHFGTTSALLVMKVFLLNLSKSNSRELLMIGIVLARIFRKPHNIRNSKPLWNFLGVVHLNVSVPQVSNCSSSKAEIPPRRNIYIYAYEIFIF